MRDGMVTSEQQLRQCCDRIAVLEAQRGSGVQTPISTAASSSGQQAWGLDAQCFPAAWPALCRHDGGQPERGEVEFRDQ